MNTWLMHRWDVVRSSFWFTPALYVVGAIGLAITTLTLDSRYPIDDWEAKSLRKASWIAVTDAAARITLGTLVGALVTVTGVVFSLTMLLLSQTTSQYGPRLVRTFMNHAIPQTTLGIFLGTSVFGIIVLRSIREATDLDPGFVPNISILVGEIGGVICLAMFIAFLHFVSQSIRAEAVVRSVYHDLRESINRIYPDPAPRNFTPPSTAGRLGPVVSSPDVEETDPAFPILVLGDEDGYLQGIDVDGLLATVTAAQSQLQLLVTPGDYVVRGDVIARATAAPDAPPIELARRMANHFVYGSQRTPRQDLECAVRELVEVAVRSLSPGINDPFTAVLCIDYLSAAFCHLLDRPLPASTVNDAEGVPRIQIRPRSFEELLSTACDQIRLYGKADAKVLRRVAMMLRRAEARTNDAETINIIRSQRDRLVQTGKRDLEDELARDGLIDCCRLPSDQQPPAG